MRTTLIPGIQPVGFSRAFNMNELERIKKRFRYHPERHNFMLYDAVAHKLGDEGKVISHPFAVAAEEVTDNHPHGVNNDYWPVGLRFPFLGNDVIVLLPQPHDPEDHPVLICTNDSMPTADIHRAASHVAAQFVWVYKDRYSNAIAESKRRKAVAAS
ncbi:MAG: hypothetical protein QOE22_646 [Candidatus Parcubacteria bacterium]|nr:hypothetical protein [Candidatus Parcubacteria bacterium]